MADRRMFNRGIFESSVMLNLAAANPDYELEAQRVWEALILIADDHGRGKYIPAAIRLRAFGSVPMANSKITIEMIENWITHLVEEGCVALYEVDNDRYYVLTKWEVYQSGVWHRAASKLPEPPSEILADCWKPTDKGIERESDRESNPQSDSESDRPLDRSKLNQSKLREIKENLRKDSSDKSDSTPKKTKRRTAEDWIKSDDPAERCLGHYVIAHNKRWGFKPTIPFAHALPNVRTCLKRGLTESQVKLAMTYFIDLDPDLCDEFQVKWVKGHKWEMFIRHIDELVTAEDVQAKNRLKQARQAAPESIDSEFFNLETEMIPDVDRL